MDAEVSAHDLLRSDSVLANLVSREFHRFLRFVKMSHSFVFSHLERPNINAVLAKLESAAGTAIIHELYESQKISFQN